MVNIATLNGQVHLYVVHKVDEAEVVNLLEYHPVVEEGDVREGLQVQNEDDGGEVDEGVQVQSEEDGGQVDVLVEIVIEEHGGEVDVPVEIVIEEHGGEVVEAIRTYGVHNGRKLKIFRNDKRKICVKCLVAKGTCKWYAYCAYKAAQSTWQLRRIINEHTCSREFNIRMITSKWLSQRLEKNIRDNPDIKLTNIKNIVGRKWNIGISRATANSYTYIIIKFEIYHKFYV